MTTVAICSPHGGKVHPNFYRNLLEMEVANPGNNFIHVDVDLQIIGKARNMCVEASLGAKADVLWFIDDDVLIPADAFILVDLALSLGVVSGLYFARRQPYTPQIYTRATEESNRGMYWPMIDYPDKSIFEVDGVGAGCLVVRADVFERLKAAPPADGLSPWFEFLDKKGEDLYFCERCKSVGQKLWANSSVSCGHIGELVVVEGHFKYLKDNGLLKKGGEE